MNDFTPVAFLTKLTKQENRIFFSWIAMLWLWHIFQC